MVKCLPFVENGWQMHSTSLLESLSILVTKVPECELQPCVPRVNQDQERILRIPCAG